MRRNRVNTMTLHRPIILVMALLMFFSQNSMADMYKCKNPDGTTVFQDKSCAEKSGEQRITKPRPKLCYTVTSSEGETLNIQDFWTEKQKHNSLFYVLIADKKTAFLSEQIHSIKITDRNERCPLVKLVNTARESFNAAVCAEIHYLSDKGEGYLFPGELDSIKTCQSKNYADGVWSLEQKKYPIQSAYVSYSKQAQQLKVLVFPFVLSKAEEDSLLKQHNVDAILSRKADSYAFGIILKLKEDADEVEISDVIQFQSLLIDSKTTRVRSYDQKWRAALNIKKLEITKSEQGRTAQISWSLNDRNEQAEVNVSAVVVEEN